MKIFIIVSLLITHATARKPNIILIYMDDMGYGDIGCFGSTKTARPSSTKWLGKAGVSLTSMSPAESVPLPDPAYSPAVIPAA